MRIYRALLHGDRLEWLEDAPESQTDAPLRVHVTVLEQEPPAEVRARGHAMAAILEQLAERRTFPRSQTLSGGSANSVKIVYYRGAKGNARR